MTKATTTKMAKVEARFAPCMPYRTHNDNYEVVMDCGKYFLILWHDNKMEDVKEWLATDVCKEALAFENTGRKRLFPVYIMNQEGKVVEVVPYNL